MPPVGLTAVRGPERLARLRRSIRTKLPAAIVAAAALGGAPDAFARVAEVDRVLNLSNADARLLGARATDLEFEDPSVALAGGDVNADGREDLVVTSASGAQVVYGPVPSSVFDMATVGPGRGFYITDETAFDADIRDAALADVTGNGDDDLILGVPRTTPPGGRVEAGSVYVVTASQNVSLGNGDSLGSAGFVIKGDQDFDRAGETVAAVEDMNGDGRAEILIGAPQRNSAYLVFGKADTADVDLRALGTRGFRLDGVAPEAGVSNGDLNAGGAVASAGDVNGDGRGDMLVGAPSADVRDGSAFTGKAYVVFGKANTGNVNLSRIGTINFPGYVIQGNRNGTLVGSDLAKVGDLNRDGRPDALVGAEWANKAYVVYGKTSSAAVDVGNLGTSGFEIDGGLLDSGVTVSSGRDVGGDDRADIVYGSPESNASGRNNAGSTYVVFGKGGTEKVDLADLGKKQGFRADGPSADILSGVAVLATRNVFGRDAPDLLVGSPYEAAAGRAAAGVTYLVDEVPDVNPELIHGLHLENREIEAASTRLHASAKREAKLRFKLRARARVTVRFMRKRTGRQAGTLERARCSKPSAAPKRPRCTRLVQAGKIVREYDGSGSKSVTLKGKAGKTKLEPGRYLLVVTAAGRKGRRGGPVLVDFRVRPRS